MSGSSSQASGNGRALVLALEVERVDRAGGRQLLDQLVAPGVGRVELEARAGVVLQHAQHLLGRLRLGAVPRAEPHRDDVGERLELAPELLGERPVGLAQREVERGRLEGPVAVAARDVAHGRVRERVELREVLGEGAKRPAAGQRQRPTGGLEGDVVEPVVDDVLADPLLAAAAQRDQRGVADELLGEGELAPLQVVALDLKWKRRKLFPGAHARRG
jgi:hypothetical protein